MTVISLANYQPSERHDGLPWTQARIEGSAASIGPWATVETIDLDPVDADPAEPMTRNFTTAEALSTQAWFRVVFLDADANELFTDPTPIARATFASVNDVEARAGRELNDYEQGVADQVIVTISGLIAEELRKDAVDLDPLPTFNAICVTRALDAVSNPTSAQTTSESLGAHSVTQTFRRSSEDFACLTDAERRAVRYAYFGRNAASARIEGLPDELRLDESNGRSLWPLDPYEMVE